jgi:hypothetical protein
MKKIILLISIISVLFLTACGPKNVENTNGSLNNEVGENNISGENSTDVMNGDDAEVFKMSFDERTKPYFDKKDATSGDRMKKEFNEIRLTKVDNHYELRANMIGDARIGLKALEAGMNQVADKTLPSIDIELENGDFLTLYGSRPQEIVEIYKELDAKRKWRQEYLDIPTFDDSDWSRTNKKSVWINKDGVPMYTYFNGEHGSGWARLQYIEGEGYYLMGRDTASRIDDWYFQTVNEVDAICIKLLPDDKIVLDIADPIGIPDEILYATFTEDKIEMQEGKTKDLTTIMQVYPSTSWVQTLDFVVADPTIAGVVNGTVVAKAAGTTTITAIKKNADGSSKEIASIKFSLSNAFSFTSASSKSGSSFL